MPRQEIRCMEFWVMCILLWCRDASLCETLGSLFFVWGMGLAGSVIRFWLCLCCSLGFEVSVWCLCYVQSSPCHVDSWWEWSSQELRKAGERKRKALQHQSILPSFYPLPLLWRTASLDRLSKFWRMWSPFQCCHSYSFLSGQYQGQCQAGDAFTSFCFLHCLSGDLLRVLCPLTSSLLFKWLKLQVQVNTIPWGRQRLAQQLCLPRPAVSFPFCFLLKCMRPLGYSAVSEAFYGLPCQGCAWKEPLPMTEMPGYTWNLIMELLITSVLVPGTWSCHVCPTSQALCWTPWTRFIPRPLSRAFLLLIATNGGKSYLKFSFSGSCLSCPFG